MGEANGKEWENSMDIGLMVVFRVRARYAKLRLSNTATEVISYSPLQIQV